MQALKEFDVEMQSMEEANSEKVDSTRSRPKQMDNSYKNAAYWQLPENVRKAIDLAKMKS